MLHKKEEMGALGIWKKKKKLFLKKMGGRGEGKREGREKVRNQNDSSQTLS